MFTQRFEVVAARIEKQATLLQPASSVVWFYKNGSAGYTDAFSLTIAVNP